MENFVERIITGDKSVFGFDAGLIQNALTEAVSLIIGIVITAFLIEALRRGSEKKRWRDTEVTAIGNLIQRIRYFYIMNFDDKLRRGPARGRQRVTSEAQKFYKSILDWQLESRLLFLFGQNIDYRTVSHYLGLLELVTETCQKQLNSEDEESLEDDLRIDTVAVYQQFEFLLLGLITRTALGSTKKQREAQIGKCKDIIYSYLKAYRSFVSDDGSDYLSNVTGSGMSVSSDYRNPTNTLP